MSGGRFGFLALWAVLPRGALVLLLLAACGGAPATGPEPAGTTPAAGAAAGAP